MFGGSAFPMVSSARTIVKTIVNVDLASIAPCHIGRFGEALVESIALTRGLGWDDRSSGHASAPIPKAGK
jgi:hypothetical protein